MYYNTIAASLKKQLPAAFLRLFYEIKWRAQLGVRSSREYLYRFKFRNIPKDKRTPFVIYMTGMPRTGSSFLKNYLGDYPGLKIMPFERRGFFISWEKSFEMEEILVDKSTHYIRHIEKIIATCGDKVAFCCIVRDPRDQLVSLFEFDRHPELERDERFWKKWVTQYERYMDLSNKNKNFYLIRYEDLVKNSCVEKIKFLKWLNIPLSRPVKSSYKVAYKNDIQDEKVSEKNEPTQNSIGRYRSARDTRHIEILNYYKRYDAAKKLMEKLGYIE
ncbi:sulfotransferase family protein [Rhodovulum sp. YNF3179]|uniref:sulfotransferase family protein n=1 Tax=Rhodovulum sp. YNF3179 TaxID=3425127 RepID=UPI003D327363